MGPTVLIVDDTEFMRFVLMDIFNQLPVGTIAEAGTVDEALSFADALGPEVAVVDATSPEADALTLLRALGVRSPDTRLLAVVAVDDRETERAVREAGAVDVLVKPYDPEAALEILREHLPTTQTV